MNSPWVKANPQVLKAQQELAQEDKHIVFTTMMGMEKVDSTHLTSKGFEEHGKRIYSAYKAIIKGQPKNASDKK